MGRRGLRIPGEHARAIADGEVIPNTGVEVLSDLVFWLSGIVPPRVRKSKVRQDSDTAGSRSATSSGIATSIRTRWTPRSSTSRRRPRAIGRNKSRDVIRYVIGFHDEKVADLEAQLDQLRGERQALSSTMASTVRVLKEVGVDSEEALNERVGGLRHKADLLQEEIETAREKTKAKFTKHAARRTAS